MTTRLPHDTDYPYAARYGDAHSPFTPEVTFHLERARFLWRWIARLGIAAAVMIFILTTVIVVITYRTARRAWLAGQLSQLSCRIVYAHQLPTASDRVPGFLRDQFGDGFWTEVVEIHVQGRYWGGNVTTEDSRAICRLAADFPALNTFTANEGSFGLSQLANWRSLNRLETLDINCESLAIADASTISQMTALKSLRIGNAKLTPEGIAALAKLPQLNLLTLHEVEFIGSAGLSKTSNSNNFPSLANLNVHQSPRFGDEAILAFGPMPQLADVIFDEVAIGDRGLEHVLRTGKVSNLAILKGKLTDASLTALANSTPPNYLDLSDMPLTDAGLKVLAGKRFPQLSLDRTALTDEAFKTLANIQGLEHVSLADTQVRGIGVNHLNPQQTLSVLDLSGTPRSAEGNAALAGANVSHLLLSRTALTDADLMLFVNNENLTELDVTQTRVTSAGISAFYTARKSRLAAAGREENLVLQSDYPELVNSFLPGDMSGMSLGELAPLP